MRKKSKPVIFSYLLPEQEKLLLAVRNFAYDMETRLMQKYSEGYCGWDDAKRYSQDRNMHDIECTVDKLKVGADKEVDLANFAMMHLFKKRMLRENKLEEGK